MNFLKTVFWVVVAVFLAIFATRNWSDVTINLWGNLQADVKIPVLVALTFLIGFLPTWFIMKGRIWGLNRKLLATERPAIPPVPAAPVLGGAPEADDDEEPAR